MNPSVGKPSPSAAGIELAQIVSVLSGSLPSDPSIPVDLETGFTYNALRLRGWPGVLVARTARPTGNEDRMDRLRAICTIHYCLRLGPHTVNARGESFEDIWINAQPPGPGRFEDLESVIPGLSSTFTEMQTYHFELHAHISSQIEDLVRSRWSSGLLGQDTPMVAPQASDPPLARF